MVMGRLSMARPSDYGTKCYGSNVPRYRINKIFNAMSETVTKSYFHNLQMRNALLQIEDQMVHANWMPDLILGINRGGCVPGVYLSHRLSREHMVLDIRLRDHRAEPDISVLTKQYEMGKKILVIDDINDTGATFKYIEEKFGRPERLRFAALVDNTPSEIRVNYKGYTIDKSKDPAWIVFPWEDWEK